ncbi:MAG TPA: F0F1 ATP synthase subunit B [Steroidobacteraceae bacterium]|nr:F0F1 ATP synthase subunit B [Steroidobacteraceae bacterium]
MLAINATFIGQFIVLLVLLWFIYRFVVPMLAGPIEERSRRIAQGLAAADEGQQSLAQAQVKADAVIREARERATQIVDQAQKRANDLVEQAKGQASAEAARIAAAAQTQIEMEATRAREALRKDVAGLAVRAASKVLEREIDARTHAELLDKLAAQI